MESGMNGVDQLGESIVPPQMFDNSAVLFKPKTDIEIFNHIILFL